MLITHNNCLACDVIIDPPLMVMEYLQYGDLKSFLIVSTNCQKRNSIIIILM